MHNILLNAATDPTNALVDATANPANAFANTTRAAGGLRPSGFSVRECLGYLKHRLIMISLTALSDDRRMRHHNLKRLPVPLSLFPFFSQIIHFAGIRCILVDSIGHLFITLGVCYHGFPPRGDCVYDVVEHVLQRLC